MKYYPLAKSLGIVLFLILVPIYFLIEFKSNAVPYIIIFFQIVLVWAQVEIALRQHTLFSTQFEPFFEVIIERMLSDISAPPSEPEKALHLNS